MEPGRPLSKNWCPNSCFATTVMAVMQLDLKLNAWKLKVSTSRVYASSSHDVAPISLVKIPQETHSFIDNYHCQVIYIYNMSYFPRIFIPNTCYISSHINKKTQISPDFSPSKFRTPRFWRLTFDGDMATRPGFGWHQEVPVTWQRMGRMGWVGKRKIWVFPKIGVGPPNHPF